MIGQCNIEGIIGLVRDSNGFILEPNVSFLDIASQVEKQKGLTELNVYIKSHGGSVEISDAIYDYLMTLREKGIKVNTFAKEYCMSAAVKILLAGEVKSIERGTEFMIHNPWATITEGDADVIEAYGRELRRLENDSISFYNQATDTSKEALKTLMKRDTYLSEEQTVEFGFADRITEKVHLKAVAFSNKINTNKNDKEMSDVLTRTEAVGLFDRMFTNIKQALTPKQVKVLLDGTGEVEVTFDELETSATPADGDIGKIDGKLATEDILMPNGDLYTFPQGDGVLKIIVAEVEVEEVAVEEVEEVVDEEKENLLTQIEVLKAELEEAKEKLNSLDKEKDEMVQTINTNQLLLADIQKDMVQLKNSIGSDFTVDVANDIKGEVEKSTSRQLFKSK